jgi:hypothetical protein
MVRILGGVSEGRRREGKSEEYIGVEEAESAPEVI